MSEPRYPASVRISRYQSNVKPYEGVRISVIDNASRMHLVEVDMTIEDFGRAVTGLSVDSAVHDVSRESAALTAKRIGKILRAEEVKVPFDMNSFYGRAKPERRRAIQLAVEGVIGRTGCDAVRSEDLTNSHRRVIINGQPHQNVAVWFYDEPKEPEHD